MTEIFMDDGGVWGNPYNLNSSSWSLTTPNFLSESQRRSLEGKVINYPARALRALGLLLADGAPTVGRGKTF